MPRKTNSNSHKRRKNKPNKCSWFVQLQANKFQGFFKDKLQYSRTKNYLNIGILWTPLITLLAKTRHGVIYNFYFFCHRSSHFLNYFLHQDFEKWLGMSCNCIWGTEIAFEIKKQKRSIVHPEKCFNNTRELYRFLHRGWAEFPLAKKSHFTGKGVLRRQGCEFQGLFKTTSKIQDLFKIVRTMKTQVWTRQPLHWSLNFTRVNRKDADASTNAMWKLLELCMMLKWELVTNCACVCVGRVNNSCACVAHVS